MVGRAFRLPKSRADFQKCAKRAGPELALGELETLARSGLAGFLPLLHPRIATK
jgi:hypothetical protein